MGMDPVLKNNTDGDGSSFKEQHLAEDTINVVSNLMKNTSRKRG
jgi:hypothetical protein